MRSVRRSQEPVILGKIRPHDGEWRDLGYSERNELRQALFGDFSGICAYCDEECDSSTDRSKSPWAETIDHFRPRSKFPHLAYDWLNLIYACERCNKAKADQWPEHDDLANTFLAAYDRFIPVSEYVNPNALGGQLPASDFFDFDVQTGEIVPAEDTSDLEWSIAMRTIRDIDLNDRNLGENDPNHLFNRRMDWLDRLITKLEAVDDFDSLMDLRYEFTRPDQPFSGFVSAYFSRLMSGPPPSGGTPAP